ncbi:unnamed protein product, partial [Allacma fusca]
MRLKSLWQGHLDLRPIQDGFAMAAYIIKSPVFPRVLPLVDQAIKEADMNRNLIPIMERPVGISEAIHVVLGLPLVQLSMPTVPLPSFNPETRVGHYLPEAEIERGQLSTTTSASDQQ